MALAVLVLGALVTALRFGVPAMVLWLAFAALAGAILLFWESLRAALDPDVSGDDAGIDGVTAELGELEARKRAAIHALKDIEFEHSIHRLSDEDYATLRERYRAEARAAMEAMDKGLGGYLARASALVEQVATTGQLPSAEGGEKKNRRKEVRPSPSGALAVSSDPHAEGNVKDVPEPAVADGARNVCAQCQTSNESDATFCKRCGARVIEES
jgi:hypothetical protein